MRIIPELLAPAGGLPQLRAAVNNGADAVYLGGARFNARGKAENFTLPRLRDAIAYAHERNVKIYVTFNTLLKDNELSSALEYGADLYDVGADAVIVQDMGLARLLRRYLPDLPLHLSTQATVYNPWAVDLMKEFGIRRIVPARELSLEEIRAFTAACHGTGPVGVGGNQASLIQPEDPLKREGREPLPACEVEVFVHGALCMCYSGQCQMSRLLGGTEGSARSGNRGLCAQPCRLPYTNDRGETGYWLSPKDLCLLEDIPALCEAGVDSFKIEGRLKSPEYVAITTSIYRKYLDQYARTGKVEVAAEDRRALTQIFNRGGFTEGYLYGNPGEDILSGASPKNTGIEIGRVRQVFSPESADRMKHKGKNKKAAGAPAPDADLRAARGAARKGAVLVDIDLTGSVEEGDGVEIRSRSSNPSLKPAGGVVTFCRALGAVSLRIGDMKGDIRPGDIVYKVTDRAQLDQARETFDSEDLQDLDRRMKRQIPVQLRFAAKTGEAAVLEIREKHSETESVCEGGFRAAARSEGPVEKALRRPADPDRIRAQLIKLGGTPFIAEPEDVELELSADCAIPISEINHMRRDAVEALLREKRIIRRTPADGETIEAACRNLKESRLQIPEAAGQKEAVGRLITVEEFMEGVPGTPCIFQVSKGNSDAYIKEHFDEIVERLKRGDCAAPGIVINNAGWIRQFLEAGVKVYGGHGLNVYNEQARLAFADLGVEVIEPSHEVYPPSGNSAYGQPLDGKIPLMITEHPVQSKTLTDRKGQVHEVETAPSGDKTIIW